ncbi:hypothetical protein HDV64DRAFT_246444 [Trichoderma sp. TUCIM 5745]
MSIEKDCFALHVVRFCIFVVNLLSAGVKKLHGWMKFTTAAGQKITPWQSSKKTKHRICATAKQATHGARSSSHTGGFSASTNSLAQGPVIARHESLPARALLRILIPIATSSLHSTHVYESYPRLQTGPPPPPALAPSPWPVWFFFPYNVPRRGTEKKEEWCTVSCSCRTFEPADLGPWRLRSPCCLFSWRGVRRVDVLE